MTKILALNSIRGKSGKDTLIGLLESEGRSVFRVAFADILKKECAEVLAGSNGDFAGLMLNDMHNSQKDTKRHALSVSQIADSPYKSWLHSQHYTVDSALEPRSLRWHLQQYGTEYKRVHLKDPDVWLNAGLKVVEEALAAKQHRFIVVTDMRLPNEVAGLMRIHNRQDNPSRFNHFMPKVARVRIVRDWFIPGVDDQPYHISDIALMAHPFDGLVVNRLGEPWAMLDQLKDQGVID